MQASILREECSGVKPRASCYRWLEEFRRCILIPLEPLHTGHIISERFGVPLFYHSKTAKFPLFTVEVPVVISVSGREALAADVIEALHAFDDVNGERQSCDPWISLSLVGEIELGGRSVLHACLSANVVLRDGQKIRLLLHQLDVTQCLSAWQRQ